jgi:hypothetical protein
MMEMWAFAAFLPLPVLVAIDPVRSADISCIYLGVINAWLVTEYHRFWGLPDSVASWRVRLLVITIAISINVALFIGFGLAAGVQTHFPFPLMAVLSIIPVIGIMPWMLRMTSQRPYAAIIFSGFLWMQARGLCCRAPCLWAGLHCPRICGGGLANCEVDDHSALVVQHFTVIGIVSCRLQKL